MKFDLIVTHSDKYINIKMIGGEGHASCDC